MMDETDHLSGQAAGSPRQASEIGLSAGELYRLVYFSVSLVKPLGGGGEEDIEAILQVSQSWNRTSGITGALTFNEQHFAQVLEGSRKSVGEIFARIRRDRRHTDVLVIEEGWIAQRDFPAWSMAYVGTSASPEAIAPNLELGDIIAGANDKARALIEMMKFLLAGPA